MILSNFIAYFYVVGLTDCSFSHSKVLFSWGFCHLKTYILQNTLIAMVWLFVPPEVNILEF